MDIRMKKQDKSLMKRVEQYQRGLVEYDDLSQEDQLKADFFDDGFLSQFRDVLSFRESENNGLCVVVPPGLTPQDYVTISWGIAMLCWPNWNWISGEDPPYYQQSDGSLVLYHAEILLEDVG